MLVSCESERVFAWIIWLSLDCVDTNWSFITNNNDFFLSYTKRENLDSEYCNESSRVYSFIYNTVQ